jgi:hypothetical protein
MCVAGWSEGSEPWSWWSERNSEGSQPTGEGSEGNAVGSEAWAQPSRGISQSLEPLRAAVRARHLDCGNASYRSDCFCSCSKPRLVQSRLVARAKAGPARVAGRTKTVRAVTRVTARRKGDRAQISPGLDSGQRLLDRGQCFDVTGEGGTGLSQDRALYRFAPPDRDGRFPPGRRDPGRVSEPTTGVIARWFTLSRNHSFGRRCSRSPTRARRGSVVMAGGDRWPERREEERRRAAAHVAATGFGEAEHFGIAGELFPAAGDEV